MSPHFERKRRRFSFNRFCAAFHTDSDYFRWPFTVGSPATTLPFSGAMNEKKFAVVFKHAVDGNHVSNPRTISRGR